MEVIDDKIEKLMKAEINIRDAISDLENQVKDLKAKREKIQSALNDICRQMNVDGLKTSVGTLEIILLVKGYFQENLDMKILENITLM